MKELAERLEKLRNLVVRTRLAHGWSQNELAAKAGIGPSTLERIEQGRKPMPTERIMQKIALAFGKEYDAAGMKFVSPEGTITLPANVITGLEIVASEQKPPMTIPEYLAAHLRAKKRLVDVTPRNPRKGSSPSEAAHAAGHH